MSQNSNDVKIPGLSVRRNLYDSLSIMRLRVVLIREAGWEYKKGIGEIAIGTKGSHGQPFCTARCLQRSHGLLGVPLVSKG